MHPIYKTVSKYLWTSDLLCQSLEISFCLDSTILVDKI